MIAFGLTACEGCNGDIATVTSSGSDLVNLTQNLEEAARFPSWSPMGGRIAFARDTCNDGCFEVNIMSSRDGSGLTPLARGSEPSWR
jgi:Tol biopolymer transport system component